MTALELQLYVDDFSKDIFQKFGLRGGFSEKSCRRIDRRRRDSNLGLEIFRLRSAELELCE